jgi:Na+/melibiose symporter-like transporter
MYFRFMQHEGRHGTSLVLVLFAVSSGVFVVVFPFFQAVLGWSALRSMLGLLPMIVAMMGASGLAATVAARLGARATKTGGVATTAGGLGLMAALASVEGGYLSVLPGFLLLGLGMGLTMTPATESITSSLPADRQGVASALNDTTREVGSALGIALLGAVLAAVYTDSMKSALSGFPSELSGPASEGIGRAFDIASQAQSSSQATALLDAARQAFLDGWVTSIWVGAAIMGALFVFLVLRPPGPPPKPARGRIEVESPGPAELAAVSGAGWGR